MIRLSKSFDKWQWLTNFEAQIKKMLGVLTDLYVSCVRPSTFNGQDEYAERELESMGNDLHNNSHYDHNKSPSPFWIIMLPYCCLLHFFFPFSLGGHRGHRRRHGGHAQEVIGPAHLEFLKEWVMKTSGILFTFTDISHRSWCCHKRGILCPNFEKSFWIIKAIIDAAQRRLNFYTAVKI